MATYILIFLMIIILLLLNWSAIRLCWEQSANQSDGASEDLDSGSAEQSGGDIDYLGGLDVFEFFL